MSDSKLRVQASIPSTQRLTPIKPQPKEQQPLQPQQQQPQQLPNPTPTGMRASVNPEDINKARNRILATTVDKNPLVVQNDSDKILLTPAEMRYVDTINVPSKFWSERVYVTDSPNSLSSAVPMEPVIDLFKKLEGVAPKAPLAEIMQRNNNFITNNVDSVNVRAFSPTIKVPKNKS